MDIDVLNFKFHSYGSFEAFTVVILQVEVFEVVMPLMLW
jgi:hypothetical protein